MREMKGIIPALTTPADADGNLDTRPIPALVRFLIERRIGGFFVGGSSGECFLLTPDERKRLAEAVVAEVAGEIPVVIHVGAQDTRVVEELSKHAKQIGADAVSSVLPFYFPYTLKDVRSYYELIAARSQLPVIVYVYTASGNMQWSAEEFVERILRIEGVEALKYTAFDAYSFWRILRLCGEGFVGYGGSDRNIMFNLVAGAVGAIGTNFSVFPEPFVELYDAFSAGDLQRALALQEKVVSLLTDLMPFNGYVRAKEALRFRGIDVGEVRPPTSRLTEEERATLRKILEKHEVI